MPVIEHLVSVYTLWYGYRDHFPKKSRYTLGDKIDSIFVDALELVSIASYQYREEKLPTIVLALRRVDSLKFFFRIAWELSILDDKKYTVLSQNIEETGRMLGGWKKGLEAKTPPK